MNIKTPTLFRGGAGHIPPRVTLSLLPGGVTSSSTKQTTSHTPQDATIAAETKAGCIQVPQYPKASPDLNAIEGWWRKLKLHLEENEPTTMETREQFLRRLRRAVNYLNKNCRAQGRKLCRNQKTRAKDCKKLTGARTKW